jgi:endo-alpha-1,4-polygalactosaminidase (GH114 family)
MAKRSKSSLTRAFWAVLLGLFLTLTACQPAASTEPFPSSTLPAAATDWWQPEQGLRWQVQYTDEIDFSVEAEVFDLDLFETTAAQIADLHARGAKAVCYLNAGAWEDWRPDREDVPAEVIGADYAGWPGERWLDIRQIDALAPILHARLDLCAAKGFDGVTPDNLDGYTNVTGFPLTAADQLAFNRWLAEEAHQRGLGIGLKNDPEQAEALMTSFDWAITESCFAEGWCDQLAPFLSAGKPVLAIEYTDVAQQTDDFCPAAASLGMDAILKHRTLDAWMEECP